MDNGCREFLFVNEFFNLTHSTAQEYFDEIFGKTLQHLSVSTLFIYYCTCIYSSNVSAHPYTCLFFKSNPSIYPSIYPSIHSSIHPLLQVLVVLFDHILFIYSFLHLFIHVFIHSSIYLSICLSIHSSTQSSISTSIYYPDVLLFIYSTIHYLSIHKKKNIESYVESCYDAIGLFLCVHIDYRYQAIMRRRNLSCLNRLLMVMF